MASTDGASSTATRGRSPRSPATRARVRLAVRAAELELCLSLVRALLARRKITVEPARRFVLAAMETASVAIVRKMLSDARAILEHATELEGRVLASAARALEAVESAAERYRALSNTRRALRTGERWSLEAAIDHSLQSLEINAIERVEEGAATPTSEALWGAPRPGVHKVAPSEELPSGFRWTAPIAASDLDG